MEFVLVLAVVLWTRTVKHTNVLHCSNFAPSSVCNTSRYCGNIFLLVVISIQTLHYSRTYALLVAEPFFGFEKHQLNMTWYLSRKVNQATYGNDRVNRTTSLRYLPCHPGIVFEDQDSCNDLSSVRQCWNDCANSSQVIHAPQHQHQRKLTTTTTTRIQSKPTGV